MTSDEIVNNWKNEDYRLGACALTSKLCSL
jgi:hypothetical protein